MLFKCPPVDPAYSIDPMRDCLLDSNSAQHSPELHFLRATLGRLAGGASRGCVATPGLGTYYTREGEPCAETVCSCGYSTFLLASFLRHRRCQYLRSAVAMDEATRAGTTGSAARPRLVPRRSRPRRSRAWTSRRRGRSGGPRRPRSSSRWSSPRSSQPPGGLGVGLGVLHGPAARRRRQLAEQLRRGPRGPVSATRKTSRPGTLCPRRRTHRRRRRGPGLCSSISPPPPRPIECPQDVSQSLLPLPNSELGTSLPSLREAVGTQSPSHVFWGPPFPELAPTLGPTLGQCPRVAPHHRHGPGPCRPMSAHVG